MLKNYILIAWRSLLKNQLFSFINIFGLALSMSLCMIVLITIVDAFEYDNFHRGKENIYRVVSQITDRQGNSWKMASSPLPLKEALRGDSGQEDMTLLYPAIHTLAKDDYREFDVRGVFIEPDFFDLFGFTLNSGTASILSEPGRLLISQSLAEKFYGNASAVGKIINLGRLGEFEVSGVVATPPSKSHIKYDVFVSMATVPSLERSKVLPAKLDAWNSVEHGYLYLRIENETSKQSIENRLNSIAREINQAASNNDAATKNNIRFELQTLSSITPGRPNFYNEIGRGPSWGTLLAQGGIGLIILLAACFNYTNLSLARALTRGKEVGIRKLSGAKRWQIFAQYITESILLALFALLLANLILTPILEFKPFNSGYEMVPSVVINFKLFIIFLLFSVFAGLLAGALPAWILSAFRPARILRGIGSEKLMGNLSFRKILMVFQFSLSLIILIFLSVFYQQFDFMENADLGYNHNNIVLIPTGKDPAVTENSFNKLSGINQTGFTSGNFGNGTQVKASRQSFDQQSISMETYHCTSSWIAITELQNVAGSNEFINSSSVIVNEKAAIALGFKNPSEAIGSVIYLGDSTATTITGVVADFYSRGYGNSVQPILLQRGEGGLKYIAVRAQSVNPTVIASLEREWKKQNMLHQFEYVWLDEDMRARHDQSSEISLMGFLAFMTVTIALLGQLGLVVYTIETRRKEISIRKIVGATVQQIIGLLSGSFVKLLMLSGAIALPLGYMLGTLFLMNFVNRVGISLLSLIACFTLLLMAGLMTNVESVTGKPGEKFKK
jgi:putative ABC transport system permease protein